MSEILKTITEAPSVELVWANYNTACTKLRQEAKTNAAQLKAAAESQCADLMLTATKRATFLRKEAREDKEILKRLAREAKEQAKQDARDAVIARREEREEKARREYERKEADRMAVDKRNQDALDRMNAERALRDLEPQAPAIIPPKSTLGASDPAKNAEYTRLCKIYVDEHTAARRAQGYEADPDEVKRIWARCREEAGLWMSIKPTL